MAEKGFTPIQTIPLFLNKSLSAGDTGTSDIIDLRYAAQRGSYSISCSVAAGTAGTAGTTVFTYQASPSFDGPYATPSAAVAMGTFGTSGADNMASFTPILCPFMKVVATQAGTGTAGKDSIVTANLIVQ